MWEENLETQASAHLIEGVHLIHVWGLLNTGFTVLFNVYTWSLFLSYYLDCYAMFVSKHHVITQVMAVNKATMYLKLEQPIYSRCLFDWSNNFPQNCITRKNNVCVTFLCTELVPFWFHRRGLTRTYVFLFLIWFPFHSQMKTFPYRTPREVSWVWPTGAGIQMALNSSSRYSLLLGWTPNMLLSGKEHTTSYMLYSISVS